MKRRLRPQESLTIGCTPRRLLLGLFLLPLTRIGGGVGVDGALECEAWIVLVHVTGQDRL